MILRSPSTSVPYNGSTRRTYSSSDCTHKSIHCHFPYQFSPPTDSLQSAIATTTLNLRFDYFIKYYSNLIKIKVNTFLKKIFVIPPAKCKSDLYKAKLSFYCERPYSTRSLNFSMSRILNVDL